MTSPARAAGRLTRIPLAFAFLTLAACSVDAPSAPTLSLAAPSAPSLQVAATAATPVQIVSATGLGCVTSTAAGTWGTDTVETCASGATDQLWTVSAAAGTAGKITVYSGTRCLTGFNGGTAGNPIGSYACQSTWTSQSWTVTTAGELRLPNGTCAAVLTTAARPTLVARACDGSTAQRFTLRGPGLAPIPVATTQQLAAPVTIASDATHPVTWSTSNGVVATVSSTGLVTGITVGSAWIRMTNGTTKDSVQVTVTLPTYPAPSATARAAVLSFTGATQTVAAQLARGGAWAKYENDFVTYAERHWASQGATQGETGANFYDRAMIYYVWWARTGNPTYLERAHQLALNSRAYIASKNYKPMLYLMMLDGVALHAIVTGDERSISTVLAVADSQARPNSYLSRQIGIHSIDGRDKSRFLSILMNAHLMKRPSPNGVDYLAGARDALTKILAAQSPDGAYRTPGQCEFNKPYMSGMLNDAFIRYYNSIEKDARIPAAVKKSVDYMWSVDWVESAQAFKYLDGVCTEPGTGGGVNAYADLNNLIVNGFGFVAKVTGDASYFTKGDAIFAGGVAKAWIAGGKQFNQNYTTSPRYFGLRF